MHRERIHGVVAGAVARGLRKGALRAVVEALRRVRAHLRLDIATLFPEGGRERPGLQYPLILHDAILRALPRRRNLRALRIGVTAVHSRTPADPHRHSPRPMHHASFGVAIGDWSARLTAGKGRGVG